MYYGQRFSGQRVDQVLEEIYFPIKSLRGTAIEVGATDGIRMSNTYYFEKERNWLCLCIEPNAYYYNQLMVNRKHTAHLAAGAENVDNALFYIYQVKRSKNESAISSLEPDSSLVDSHRNIILGQRVEFVNVRRLDWILNDTGIFVPPIDLVSIDTEGTELDVLMGFSLGYWGPRVLVIENHHPKKSAIRPYMKDAGYDLDYTLGPNDFFVRERK